MGYPRQNPTWEQIARLRRIMGVEKKNITQCANEFGVAHKTVKRWAMDNGIMPREPKRPTNKQVIDAFRRLNNVGDVSLELDFCKKKIARILSKYGYEYQPGVGYVKTPRVKVPKPEIEDIAPSKAVEQVIKPRPIDTYRIQRRMDNMQGRFI